VELGIDRPGHDISGMGEPASSPAACCDLCTGNPACAAWSYQVSAQACWLKNFAAPVDSTMQNDCCVSGVARGRPVSISTSLNAPVVQQTPVAQQTSPVATSSGGVPRASATLGANTVVLIIAHNRPTYLSRCLSALQRYHPGGNALPVIVSEDRDGEEKGRKVDEVVQSAAAKLRAAGAAAVDHVKFPDGGRGAPGYARLARHYKWALSTAFESRSQVRRVIVL
jgi:hypothetical protein